VGRGLLGDEPGLGKSRVAIDAFDGGRVLVVAPAMVIRGGTWDDELEKWADHPDRFTIAPFTGLNARNGNTPNFGTRKNPKYRLRPEFERDWDAIVVDEAHYTKGRGTSWTWAVDQLAKRSGAVLEMTGTPAPNWAHEMFTILRVLRPEEARPGRPLGSNRRWVETWFDTSPSWFNERAITIGGLKACYPECDERPPSDPCEHWHRFMKDNFGDQFLRRLRSDVLGDLPPATTQVVHTPMEAVGKRAYRQLRDEYLTVVGDQEVVAWSDGSRNVLLDQITVSPWFLTCEGEPRGGKLDQLRFDLEGRSAPTLVFAHYRKVVEACAQVARSTGARVGMLHGGVSAKDQSRAVADFKSGRSDVLVGSLETLAEGLTLTVADMAIFVERSFKPSRNDQAEKRIHRMGQTRPVTIRDYVTPHSVDAKKRELLATKTDQQMRALSAAQFAALL